MKKEDIEFLKNLRETMLNQESDSQASPRFWTIMQKEKEYWVDDNINGIFIYDSGNCETIFEGEEREEEFEKWFKEFVENETCSEVTEIDFSIDFSFALDGEMFYLSGIHDLSDFIYEHCDKNINIGYYRNTDVIKENTMFLTKEDAKNHLKYNAHHYNSTAHTYAMTAWRSPSVARLFEIIENTDWDKELSIKEE